MPTISTPTFNVGGPITATTGTFSGAVSCTTLTGTLSTAAQPSITSLGTLTSLVVSGTSTLGAMTAASITTATASNSTATGTTWTTAFGLTASRIYFVSVASNTSGQDQAATAIYALDTADNVRITDLGSKAGTALSASGTTVTVVNTSGTTQNYQMTLIRIL